MSKLLVILVFGLVCEAIGVVLLSRGLKQIGEIGAITVPEVVRAIKAGVTNPNILLGVFFEALFFGALLVMMSRSDVSFIWPLTALSFVMTTLAAKFYLHEQVTLTRWAGVALIMMGAGLITWSEKSKQKSPAETPTQEAPASVKEQ